MISLGSPRHFCYPMEVELPAFILVALRLFLGDAVPPVPVEERLEDRKILEYRIPRVWVRRGNGWNHLAAAGAKLEAAGPEETNALTGALNSLDFDALPLRKRAEGAEESLRVIREALAMPFWQGPWDRSFDLRKPDTKPGEYAEARRVFAPVFSRCLLRVSEPAACDPVLDDLELVMRISDTARVNAVSLADGFFALSLRPSTARIMVLLVARGGLSQKQLARMAGILGPRRLEMKDFQECFRHESTVSLESVLDVRLQTELFKDLSGRSPVFGWLQPHLFDVQASRDYWNQQMAGIVVGLGDPYKADGLPAFRQVRGYLVPPDNPLELIRFNGIGVRACAGALRSLEKAHRSICMLLAGEEAVAAGVAITRARGESGGDLPETLAALVPRYLPGLPMDPILGEPLRYDREKRIIFSVGADQDPSTLEIPSVPSLMSLGGEVVLLLP